MHVEGIQFVRLPVSRIISNHQMQMLAAAKLKPRAGIRKIGALDLAQFKNIAIETNGTIQLFRRNENVMETGGNHGVYTDDNTAPPPASRRLLEWNRGFRQMEKDSGSSVAWFLAGAAAGAAIALLYAPKTGKDTRKMIHKTTRQGARAVESTGQELMDRGKELYERGQKIAEEAAELFERGRKLVQN